MLPDADPLKVVVKPFGWQPAPLPERLPDVVGFDTETTGLRWWDGDRPVGLSVAWNEGGKLQSRYLPWGHRGGGNLEEANVKAWARDVLRHKRLVGLNVKFDAHMMYQWGVDLEGQDCRLSDVGHYAALLDDHRVTFNLEAVANDFLGDGKIRGLTGERMADYPAWQVEPYAEKDASLVHRLLNMMDPMLAQQDLIRVRDLEDAVTWAAIEMERNGARIDVEKLARWNKEAERDLMVLHFQIAQEAGFRLSPDSREHMTRLFRERGLVSDALTDGGAPSYSDAVLARIAKTDPLVAKIRRASHLSDLLAKYLKPYLASAGRTGILRTAFHQLRSATEEGGARGTISGRFSSSQPVRGEGANLQQVMSVAKQLRLHCAPCEDGELHGKKISLERHRTEAHPEARIIRELFIADPGSLLSASDAKQIEYRIFVHLSRSKRLIDMYRENPDIDFHATVGDIVAKYRPDFDRKRIKNLNFACVPPDTPVLCDDLKWTRAGDLVAGDGLLAFDEELNEGLTGRERARRWRAARVLDNGLITRDCVEIDLENGEILVSTLDHRWLVDRIGRDWEHNGWGKKGRWLRSDALIPGDRIVNVTSVVNRSETWEAGWLGGFFDGEGCVSTGVGVSAAQNVGPTLDRAIELAKRHAQSVVVRTPRFDPRGHMPSTSFGIDGPLENKLEFLMRVRPERLISRFTSNLPGRTLQAKAKVRVVAVRPVGPRLVAALGTTTQTYIAGGYASHNTLFGAGINRIADMMGIDSAEAEELIETYDKAFPEAKKTLRAAGNVGKARGFVRTILGRRIRFPEGCTCPADMGRRPRYHKALNGADQGSAADIMKMKMVDLHARRKELGLLPRLTVHDEYVGDVRDKAAAEAVDKALNEQAYPLSVPILWSTETGANWAECK